MSDTSSRHVFSYPIPALYAWTYAEPRAALLERLAERSLVAGTRDTAVWLGDEEFRFVLRGHGWRNYPFVLSGADFEIAFGAQAPFPRIVITAFGSFVERLGPEEARNHLGNFLAAFLLEEPGPFYWYQPEFDPVETVAQDEAGDAA